MRITRPTLNIFLGELEQLSKDAEVLKEHAKDWAKQQEHRDDGYGVDQWYMQHLRYKLEKSIIKYRQQLAKIYDFSGDSGLR